MLHLATDRLSVGAFPPGNHLPPPQIVFSIFTCSSFWLFTNNEYIIYLKK